MTSNTASGHHLEAKQTKHTYLFARKVQNKLRFLKA